MNTKGCSRNLERITRGTTLLVLKQGWLSASDLCFFTAVWASCSHMWGQEKSRAIQIEWDKAFYCIIYLFYWKASPPHVQSRQIKLIFNRGILQPLSSCGADPRPITISWQAANVLLFTATLCPSLWKCHVAVSFWHFCHCSYVCGHLRWAVSWIIQCSSNSLALVWITWSTWQSVCLQSQNVKRSKSYRLKKDGCHSFISHKPRNYTHAKKTKVEFLPGSVA